MIKVKIMTADTVENRNHNGHYENEPRRGIIQKDLNTVSKDAHRNIQTLTNQNISNG